MGIGGKKENTVAVILVWDSIYVVTVHAVENSFW